MITQYKPVAEGGRGVGMVYTRREEERKKYSNAKLI
jgi:hypothetical protein